MGSTFGCANHIGSCATFLPLRAHGVGKRSHVGMTLESYDCVVPLLCALCRKSRLSALGSSLGAEAYHINPSLGTLCRKTQLSRCLEATATYYSYAPACPALALEPILIYDVVAVLRGRGQNKCLRRLSPATTLSAATERVNGVTLERFAAISWRTAMPCL